MSERKIWCRFTDSLCTHPAGLLCCRPEFRGSYYPELNGCHDPAFLGLPESRRTMPRPPTPPPDRPCPPITAAGPSRQMPSHTVRYATHHNAGGLDTHSPDDTTPGTIHKRHNGSSTAPSRFGRPIDGSAMGSPRAYCPRPNAGAGRTAPLRLHNNAGAPAFVLRPIRRCHRRLPKWARRRGFPGHTNIYKPDAPFRTSRRSSSIISPLVPSSPSSPRHSPAKRFAFCSFFRMLSDRL